MISLEERKAKALQLRKEGYNCAQSVLLVFDDCTNLPFDLAARLSSGLGAGLGATREVCGVVNGMALAQGMKQSPLPAGKVASMKTAGQLALKFAADNEGDLRCADLKGKPGRRSCEELILQGVELLHNYFTNEAESK